MTKKNVRDCCLQILPLNGYHEKAKANQNWKHTWPLDSSNKRQSAEIGVATAPAQSALLASATIQVSRLPHYIYHSLNKAHPVINSLSSFTDISSSFLLTEKWTFANDFIRHKIKPNSSFYCSNDKLQLLIKCTGKQVWRDLLHLIILER